MPEIDPKDRYMALRWAHALELAARKPVYSDSMQGDFRESAALLRRLVGATPDEDISEYQKPHPDEIREAEEARTALEASV